MSSGGELAQPLDLSAVLTQLAGVELSDPYKERVGDLLPVFHELCPERLEMFFVSERRDAERGDQIEIESLWGFSQSYWLEAREFLTKVDLDIAPYRVSYLGLESEHYLPFGPATEDATLAVEVETGRRTYSFLSATGTNCEYLASIVKDRLIPNLSNSAHPGRKEAE